MAEKRPRQYAAEICSMRTVAERRAAMDEVPETFREWVKRLVTMTFERRKR